MDSGSLVRALAELYPDDESIRRLFAFAGIPTSLLRLTNRPVDSWFTALQESDRRRKRTALLEVVIAEYPHDPRLQEALGESLDAAGPGGPILPTASDPGVEKLMGAQSTLLPIAFLSRGLQRSRSVARINTPEGVGSGFLISGDRIVTNHHVIPTPAVAARSSAQFDYQSDWQGVPEPFTELPLEPKRAFATSEEADLTVVGIAPGSSNRWGYLEADTEGARPQRVNIVQHPGGGLKQVALYHNVVSFADDQIIHYYTDTLPGSSGSPLFDDQWNLVGVHHAGGLLRSPTGGSDVYRNEGIAVARLRSLLASLEIISSARVDS